jgi:hypothetical protein
VTFPPERSWHPQPASALSHRFPTNLLESAFVRNFGISNHIRRREPTRVDPLETANQEGAPEAEGISDAARFRTGPH